jgi:hypothetical protein
MKKRREALLAEQQHPHAAVVRETKSYIDRLRSAEGEELVKLRLALRGRIPRLVRRVAVLITKDGGARVADVAVEMANGPWRGTVIHSRNGVSMLMTDPPWANYPPRSPK